MKPFLSVIVPVHGEAGDLPLTLIDIDKKLSLADYSYEIIVVSDGFGGETAGMINRFSRLVNNLKLIDGKADRGKGWAIKAGMSEAKGNYRLLTDAYNSISLDNFDKMLPYFKEGCGVVAGSRIRPGFGANLENFFARVLARSDIRDIRSGFVCFTEEAADRILASSKIDRWGFEAEIFALAGSFGYRIKEIPVNWVRHPHSVLGFGPCLSMLWNVSRFRRSMKRG